MAERERDEVTGTETTGHEWDGIKELDTPLPRWWLWTFYGTIVWGLIYIILYPAIPLVSTNTKGLFGTTNRIELQKELEQVKQARAEKLAQLNKLSMEEIWKNDELRQFAIRMGEASFKVNCVVCHQAGGQGALGYPNLADDEWIWGGTLDAIHFTITNGIRYNPDTNEDTRQSEMPAFGEQLTPEQIDAVSEYVLKLAGYEHDAKKAEEGKQIFAEEAGCNGCHGENGEGIADVGGPPLNNKIWLYGFGFENDAKKIKTMVMNQVRTPKHGVMPAWKGRLDAATIKALTAYVFSLGGGVGS